MIADFINFIMMFIDWIGTFDFSLVVTPHNIARTIGLAVIAFLIKVTMDVIKEMYLTEKNHKETIIA